MPGTPDDPAEGQPVGDQPASDLPERMPDPADQPIWRPAPPEPVGPPDWSTGQPPNRLLTRQPPNPEDIPPMPAGLATEPIARVKAKKQRPAYETPAAIMATVVAVGTLVLAFLLIRPGVPTMAWLVPLLVFLVTIVAGMVTLWWTVEKYLLVDGQKPFFVKSRRRPSFMTTGSYGPNEP